MDGEIWAGLMVALIIPPGFAGLPFMVVFYVVRFMLYIFTGDVNAAAPECGEVIGDATPFRVYGAGVCSAQAAALACLLAFLFFVVAVAARCLRTEARSDDRSRSEASGQSQTVRPSGSRRVDPIRIEQAARASRAKRASRVRRPTPPTHSTGRVESQSHSSRTHARPSHISL